MIVVGAKGMTPGYHWVPDPVRVTVYGPANGRVYGTTRGPVYEAARGWADRDD